MLGQGEAVGAISVTRDLAVSMFRRARAAPVHCGRCYARCDALDAQPAPWIDAIARHDHVGDIPDAGIHATRQRPLGQGQARSGLTRALLVSG